ncbi:MAG: L-threonylcarbamoyladenylate synthase [Candidatus Rokuibacteriota bacterium]
MRAAPGPASRAPTSTSSTRRTREGGHLRLLRIDPARPEMAALHEAAAVLRAGGLVGLPTETFYGLGAAALNPAAVRRIFMVKGRSEDKPLLLLVDSIEMAETVAADIPAAARPLMARHWPGALTLVFRARSCVPDPVTAGTGTVGVRVSAHPVATGLARVLGQPVTAPSANREGARPPVTADDVLAELAGAVDLLLDAGPTPGGLPSTVLDMTAEPARMIRQGAVRLCG